MSNFQLTAKDITKMSEYGIPERMQGGLIRYFNKRIRPGHFLTAVLENDLMEAFGRADNENRNVMHSYAVWLYNCGDGRASGSKQKVKDWLNGKGDET